MPIAYFWQEFSHRCKMAFVLIWLFSVFLFHLSAAQDGWFDLFFCPCLPIYTDVLSCFLHFHNKVLLPHSPSVGWGHPDESSLVWALKAHFYIILPSFCPSDTISHAPAFTCLGADRPKLRGGQVPAGWSLDVVWPCWLASCPAFILGASSLQWGESKFRAVCPCFCKCCYRLKGFHCTRKIANFAVITSLLAQQLRRLHYLSGYWVSAARMLSPLLRGQRI